MTTLRFALFGAGFWSRFQLAAWRELEGVDCVAIYNRTRSKAEALAKEFGVGAVYDDPDQLLAAEQLDFVDIVTDPDTHSRFVQLAAAHRLPVICQKPMAPTLAAAEHMVETCRAQGVPFLIHENWRWQTPIRRLQQVLDDGVIGRPFRARINFVSSFPVFDNQPFLKELEQFILVDIGSHILDTARSLFGEVTSLSCHTLRINRDIKGEDVATVMLKTESDATIVCEMSYASRTEHERFPETFIFVEGEQGSAELAPGYWIRVTTADGTHARRYPPTRYPWADPAYDLIHASIVPCNADLLQALRGVRPAETSAEDNIKTIRLVFAAYEAARTGQVVNLEASDADAGADHGR